MKKVNGALLTGLLIVFMLSACGIGGKVSGIIDSAIANPGGTSTIAKDSASNTTQENSVAIYTTDFAEKSSVEVTTSTTAVKEDFSNVEKQYKLTAGHYVVGVDIPVGRCTIKGVSGNGNIMSSDYDGLNGINAIVADGTFAGLFESYRMQKDAIWYVSNTGVIELNYSSITGAPKGREYETDPIMLSSGRYVVGQDIEAGVYNVEVVSGQGNFMAGNFMEGGANEVMGLETEAATKFFKNLILHNDDEITITLTLQVNLFKAK